MESVSILGSPGMTRDLIKNAENEDFKDMKRYESDTESVYEIYFSKTALEGLKQLEKLNLINQARDLLELIQKDPFAQPPQYNKLVGNLDGFYSHRINIHHRLIYKVYEEEKKIKVLQL